MIYFGPLHYINTFCKMHKNWGQNHPPPAPTTKYLIEFQHMLCVHSSILEGGGTTIEDGESKLTIFATVDSSLLSRQFRHHFRCFQPTPKQSICLCQSVQALGAFTTTCPKNPLISINRNYISKKWSHSRKLLGVGPPAPTFEIPIIEHNNKMIRVRSNNWVVECFTSIYGWDWGQRIVFFSSPYRCTGGTFYNNLSRSANIS